MQMVLDAEILRIRHEWFDWTHSQPMSYRNKTSTNKTIKNWNFNNFNHSFYQFTEIKS